MLGRDFSSPNNRIILLIKKKKNVTFAVSLWALLAPGLTYKCGAPLGRFAERTELIWIVKTGCRHMGFQKNMHMQQLTVSLVLTQSQEIFQSQGSLVLPAHLIYLTVSLLMSWGEHHKDCLVSCVHAGGVGYQVSDLVFCIVYYSLSSTPY